MNLKECIADVSLADLQGQEQRSDCPSPSRWWAVELGEDSWSDEESVHIENCNACLRSRARFKGEPLSSLEQAAHFLPALAASLIFMLASGTIIVSWMLYDANQALKVVNQECSEAKQQLMLANQSLEQQRLHRAIRIVANPGTSNDVDVQVFDWEGKTLSRERIFAETSGNYTYVLRPVGEETFDTNVRIAYDAKEMRKADLGEVVAIQPVNGGADVLIGGGYFEETGRLRLLHLDSGTYGDLDLEFPNKLTSLAVHQDNVAWVVKSGQGAQLYFGKLNELSQQTSVFDNLDSTARVAFSPDGSRMAVATENGTLRVWDMARLSDPPLLDQKLESENIVYCLTFRSDGQTLVVGTGQWKPWDRPRNEGKLLIVDINTKKTTRVIDAHDGPVFSIATSPSDETVATAGADGAIKLWDLKTGNCLRTANADVNGENGHSNMVQCVRYSPDGKFIATGSWDNTVRVWRAGTLERVAQMKRHENFVQAVEFSADGKRLMSGGADDSVRFWEFKVLEGA